MEVEWISYMNSYHIRNKKFFKKNLELNLVYSIF